MSSIDSKVSPLYVILCANGKVGSTITNCLLQDKQRVRAVVRSETQANVWKSKGAEIALADVKDSKALSLAIHGADVLFVMNPPNMKSEDMVEESKIVAHSILTAINQEHIANIFVLSSYGAELSSGSVRCGFFLENFKARIPIAKSKNILLSLIAPITKTTPMVSTDDIGNLIAEEMKKDVNRHKNHNPKVEIIELYNDNYSAIDIAKAMSEAMNLAADKPLTPVAVEESKLHETISQWGLPPKNVNYCAEMVQGVNAGRIVFLKKSEYKQLKGTTPIQQTFAAWLK